MDKPRIADTKPVVLELAAGKHAWCTCGEAGQQPFCDGSHSGGAFKPQVFETAETKTAALCACKHTSNPPYCDGAHANLDTE